MIGGRSENQDSAGFADTPLGTIVVVCDGMGGLQGGKQASALAVNTVLDCFRCAESDENPADVMRSAIEKANSAIIDECRRMDCEGMGSTIIAILFNSRSAVVAQVGDSRAYQLRKGQKIFRTDDHSMVFDMVKANVITEEQARLSNCSNIILKALGISGTVEPDIVELPYLKGDRFVLCTDGFWSATDEKALLKALSKKESPDKLLASLTKKIDGIGEINGGTHDNLTAAIIDMQTNSILKDESRRKRLFERCFIYSLLVISLGFNIYAAKELSILRNARKELSGLRDDLKSAQENLTSQKIEKILEKMGGYYVADDTVDDFEMKDDDKNLEK